MSKIAAWWRWLLTEEAALVSWVSAGGLTALLAFVGHLNPDAEAKAAVICAAAATIWTAVWHHPPELALLTGGISTIATAIGVSFHPSTHTIALIGTLLGVLLGFLHRHSFPPAHPVGRPGPAAATRATPSAP